MWIQVRDSDDVVTRLGDTKRSPREGASDYEVDSLPDYEPGEILKYDGTAFSIDPNTEARKMELEPQLLFLYRKWQDALSLGFTCEPHCKAEYDALKAVYDAL
tara:strand:- start:2047 stop:2355 length:309 start_codon:yes stop_codon:yes gene_type:complete